MPDSAKTYQTVAKTVPFTETQIVILYKKLFSNDLQEKKLFKKYYFFIYTII
jgi:hypothetical protein